MSGYLISVNAWGKIAEINKIRVSGPVTEEQKAILERFGAELEFYDNY